MTSPWTVLGIAETTDKTAIKRAYAILIRRHNPQTDVEGFKRVREAYERALAEAEYASTDLAEDEHLSRRHSAPSIADRDFQTVESEPALRTPARGADHSLFGERTGPTTTYATDELTAGIAAILESPSKRRCIDEWRNLFADPAMLDSDTRAAVGDSLFVQLAQMAVSTRAASRALAAMPAEVWLFIDQTFGWSATEIDLAQLYPPIWVDVVMAPILKAQGKAAKPGFAMYFRETSPGTRKRALRETIVWLLTIIAGVVAVNLARLFLF